ncbi:MAG: DUF1573 domain-containing protein [Planctomycetes bacterium]|nr:DUF1573 domain-containing protein [Planctomycetota bacterium]
MVFHDLKKCWVLLHVIVLAIFLSASDVAAESVATLQESSWNFGEIQYGESVSKEFEITNTSLDELKIHRIQPSCVCIKGEIIKDTDIDKRLIAEPNGDMAYLDGEGRRDKFILNQDSSYTAPVGLFAQLTKNPDDSYTLRYSQGYTIEFDVNGSSNIERDTNGNYLTILRNACGIVEGVIDTRGNLTRVIYATYIVTFQDYTGREVVLTLDENMDLISLRSPVTLDFPQGKKQYFDWYSGNADSRFNHNMRAELRSLDNGATWHDVFSNIYDSNDHVIQQILADWTFGSAFWTYTPMSPSFRTTYTDPNGNITETEQDDLGNVTKREVFTNRDINPNDPASFVTLYEYNTNGLATKVTYPEGNSVENTYDETNPDPLAQDNLLQSKRIADTLRGGGAGYNQIISLYTYEPNFNQVISATDAKGKTTSYIIDPLNGNLLQTIYPTVTLADNSTTQNITTSRTYNSFGQIETTTDGEGVITKYEYYPAGDSLFGYLRYVTRDFDGPNEIRTETKYNETGNVTERGDGFNRFTIYTVNELNQVTQTTSRAPFSYVTRYAFDYNNNVASVDVENRDENGIQNPANPWINTFYTYDILNNRISDNSEISEGVYATTVSEFDKNGNLQLVTEPEQNQKRMQYDERDLLYNEKVGYGSSVEQSTRYTYTWNGNLYKTESACACKGDMTYFYDGFDRRVKSQDLLGNFSLTFYDENSNVYETQSWGNKRHDDPAIAMLSHGSSSYDEINRRKTSTNYLFNNPGSTEQQAINKYFLDKNSRLTRTEDPSGSVYIYEFDSLGRTKKTTDPLGNTVEYNFNNNSNVTQVTETEYPDNGGTAQVFTTLNSYDELDRLTSATDNAGQISQYKYDSRNNSTRTIDREGNITRRENDSAGRLVRQVQENPGATDPEISVSYGYDKNSRLTSLTDDNGNTTLYAYYETNAQKYEEYPDGSRKTNYYNNVGLLISYTDPNGTIVSLDYDNAGRLVNKLITRASGIEGTTFENFGYDGLGRMTFAEDDDSIVKRWYNSYGNVTEEHQTVETGLQPVSTQIVKNDYNKEGFRTNLTYPNGRVVNYNPDELNRIDTISENTEEIVDYNYVGASRACQRIYQPNSGNPITLNIGYNSNRWVESYIYTGARTWQATEIDKKGKPKKYDWVSQTIGFSYDFDKEGNKLYEQFLHRNNEADLFHYDNVFRLDKVKYGVSSAVITNIDKANYDTYFNGITAYQDKEVFNMDNVGNRTTVTNGITTNYTTNNLNQYTAINVCGTVSYPDGNPVTSAEVCLIDTKSCCNIKTKCFKTNEKGEFIFELSYPCEYELWVEKVKYVPFVKDIIIDEKGLNMKLDIKLEKGASIYGQVVDNETNIPIEGVRVEYASRAEAPFNKLFVLTDKNGNFTIEGIENGMRHFSIPEFNEYSYKEYGISIKNAQSVDIRIGLEKGTSISGRIVEKVTKFPLENVKITCPVLIHSYHEGPSPFSLIQPNGDSIIIYGGRAGGKKQLKSTKSNNEGFFNITGIKDGAYCITAELEGFRMVLIDKIIIKAHKPVENIVIEMEKEIIGK